MKNRSTTAADIKVASLAGVASAVSAASATHSNAAGGLDKISYISAPSGVPAAPPPDAAGNQPTTTAGASATCPPGTFAIARGVGVDDNATTAVVDSFPEPGGHAWTARVDNSDPRAAHGFTVVAVCFPPSRPADRDSLVPGGRPRGRPAPAATSGRRDASRTVRPGRSVDHARIGVKFRLRRPNDGP